MKIKDISVGRRSFLSYDTKEKIRPSYVTGKEVVLELTPRQVKLALDDYVLPDGRNALDTIQTFIDNLPENMRRTVNIEWLDARTFKRNSETLVELASYVGLSEKDLDIIFEKGSQYV